MYHIAIKNRATQHKIYSYGLRRIAGMNGESNLSLLAWTEADELSVTRSELGRRRRRQENTR